jgi:glyoxylase-like metal-dependent hydrolase (beta-lactamase superfamily II)
MKFIRSFIASLGLLAYAAAAPAQPVGFTRNMADAREILTDLGHGVYMLECKVWPTAGNVTFAVGGDGILLVDTQFEPLHDRIVAAIRGVSKQPLKFVVNTHFHRDHVGGNEAFGRDGAVLVSEAQAAVRIAQPPERADGSPGLRLAAIGWPAVTYDDAGLTLRLGGQTAQLFHPAAPAHTDGDTFVVFPEANVIATGDLINMLLYPQIDVGTGASIDGLIAAVDRIAALANKQTRLVPGHGPVTDKAGLLAYRAMLVTARQRIVEAKARGMTEQQVAQAHLLDDLDPRWLPPGVSAERFPLNVYRSLK